jgi:hypothetical protein
MRSLYKYGLGLVFLTAVAGAISNIKPSSPDTGKQVSSQPTQCPAIARVGPPVSSVGKFTVKIATSVQGDSRKPVIAGRTNLPVGTKLLIYVERKASSYSAEDESTVGNSGCFSGGPFDQGGEPIGGGEYVVRVLMPASSAQPQSVQNVIGSRGQNIVGPLVKPFSVVSLRNLGKVAEYKTSFTTGTADTQKDADARQSAANDEQKRLESLRSSAALLATKTLKANLRNPSSADWVSVYTNKDGSGVCIILRAQNGFGGMSIERYAVADQDFSKEISVWNKRCAGNGFYDYTTMIKWN